MRRRFAALAVAGSLALGGVLVASPAHAWVTPVPEEPGGYTVIRGDGGFGKVWTDETRRAAGVYHWRFGRAQGGYRWNDMLDKKKNHRTETTHYDAYRRVVTPTYKVSQYNKGHWSKNFQAAKGIGAVYSVARF